MTFCKFQQFYVFAKIKIKTKQKLYFFPDAPHARSRHLSRETHRTFFYCMLQQTVTSTGVANSMALQKGSQRPRDYAYGTGSAGSLAHASNYFNSAKYVDVCIFNDWLVFAYSWMVECMLHVACRPKAPFTPSALTRATCVDALGVKGA